ncbi:ParB/RepB/Spo0J family partition protein [Xanthomonas hortorum]|uniref:ParB/RepB/Spo0J family partition protein n=1 Tax=Xanthomonas hortorum TaxID=56454 RepID=UPI0032E9294C
MIDLSRLDETPAPLEQGVIGDGKPLQIPLDDIEEDENQPRKEFSEEKMREMEAGIRLRGVRQPVSVRSHPEKPGKWILNFGARRYRGSRRAGVSTIPAFIDETSDDFDQVIENEHRDNLKPMELALWIKGKLDKGVKKAEIARRLALPASAITFLLALIDAPECVENAYRSGRCTSPQTLYDLRALHNKFPSEVEAWCETAEEISRKNVIDLGDTLKNTKKQGGDAKPEILFHEKGQGPSQADGKSEQGGSETLFHEKGNGKVESSGSAADAASAQGDAAGTSKGTATAETANVDNGELTSWPRGKAVSDPDSMKRPLLIVEHDGRAAAVLLNRRPSSAGLLRIRYEDGGGDAEVDAGAVRINRLAEGDK